MSSDLYKDAVEIYNSGSGICDATGAVPKLIPCEKVPKDGIIVVRNGVVVATYRFSDEEKEEY